MRGDASGARFFRGLVSGYPVKAERSHPRRRPSRHAALRLSLPRRYVPVLSLTAGHGAIQGRDDATTRQPSIWPGTDVRGADRRRRARRSHHHAAAARFGFFERIGHVAVLAHAGRAVLFLVHRRRLGFGHFVQPGRVELSPAGVELGGRTVV